ncbi:Predicted amino acid racemase [Anaerovirgula multivorans]|uniref:Predicted amino acid racemase n=1 Tax=Anaerovirgula multivorans TaxID=312168 RepID=A0A239HLP2_9FIRM|nr:alanine/ornithine racemase family PLP-dependent enzyme [Anaerovirgula multivorans]SNS81763.1 Predicted amino acid racemase [Anaerovirgula multivorans]
MYPKVKIDAKKLKNNINTLKTLCKERNIEITGVTKVFSGDNNIAKILVDGGLNKLADSRIENLKNLKDLKSEKWLIRPPMKTEIDELIEYADASLNSELETIEEIDKKARKEDKVHKIILMADLGDIREGYVDYEELIEVAIKVEEMKNVHLYGIGVNLTCFSFIQYSSEKLEKLVNIAEKIEKRINRKLEIISGGNSAAIDLMLRNEIPNRINNLRLGESILFGKERSKYKYLENTNKDVFILEAEIIEIKNKPSMPWGEIGVDSYGNKPEFSDIGIRKKAICALGKQDFDVETSRLIDEDIKILGASSDHFILDITDSNKKYELGDIIEIELGYFSTMRAFTSKYVKKHNQL